MPREIPIIPDPEEPEFEEPEKLTRLRATFTYDKQLKEFRGVFGRDPSSEDELTSFVEEFTREMYNDGWNEIPD